MIWAYLPCGCVLPGPCVIVLLRDDYDTEESPLTDEEERPLSQGELRQRIMKGVSYDQYSLTS